MGNSLPIIGRWGLARRLVHVRNGAARDAALGIARMREQPSDKWFDTSERYRQEDVRRYFASLSAQRREAGAA